MDKQSYDKQKYEREIEEILAKYEKEVEHKEGVEKPARQLGSFPSANARRKALPRRQPERRQRTVGAKMGTRLSGASMGVGITNSLPARLRPP